MCKRHPKVIPRSPQSDPKVVQLSHKVAQGLTRSQKVPQGPKRSHKASQGLTRSHKVSQGLTWSHKVSQERIYFRSVWLGSDWFGFAIRSHKRGDISGQSGSDRTGSGLTTDAGDLWTSWGISGQTSLDTSQSVGYPVGRKCVPSRIIYIYIKRHFLLGLALFGDIYIRCKDSARAHIFALHCASGVQTDSSSNSIQQHRVPAWPAGRPREYQHGLLVVPAQRASTHAPSCSRLPRLFQRTLFNTRTFVLTHTRLFQRTLLNTQPNNAGHRLQCETRAIRQW